MLLHHKRLAFIGNPTSLRLCVLKSLTLTYTGTFSDFLTLKVAQET